MFVVKRPFRDTTGMLPAGSIVKPAGIKRFKRRVLEGHIVEVTEQNFDKYADFFKQRFGVVLQRENPAAVQEILTEDTSDTTDDAHEEPTEDTSDAAHEEPTEDVKPAKAKATAVVK